MKNCPNCNRLIADETAFCPGCGAQIPADTAPAAPQPVVYGEQSAQPVQGFVPYAGNAGTQQSPCQPQTPLEMHRGGNGMAPNMVMPSLPMSFHNFYQWYLMVIGGLAGLSCIVSLLNSHGSVSIASLASAALSFCAGFFLYRKAKAGFVLQKVRNILNIVADSFLALFSLIWILGGGTILAALDDLGAIAGGTFVVLGVILLLIAAGGIVVNACVLKYYEKRRDYFQG